MIRLRRLNDHEIVVNAELIESVEAHGVETVLYMATGNRIVVKESVAEIVGRVVEYRKTVYVGASYLPAFLQEGKDPRRTGSSPQAPSKKNNEREDETCRH